MRRFMLLVALAGLIFVTAASPSQPFSFSRISSGRSAAGQGYVEQQTDWPLPDPSRWVINPGNVGTWDINESSSTTYVPGYLNPGVSVTREVLMLSDMQPVYKTINGTTGWYSVGNGRNKFGILVGSPSPGLVVQACYSPQGRCFTATAIWDQVNREYYQSICSFVMYNPDDPALQDIAGSQSGRGVPTTISLSITNTSSRQVKNVSVSMGTTSAAGLGTDSGPGCAQGWTPLVEYPYHYLVS